MRDSATGTSARQRASLWGAALAVHALVLAWCGWRLAHHHDLPLPGVAQDRAARAAGRAADLTPVALIDSDDHRVGPPLEAPPGPADIAGTDAQHPRPRADLDLPGAAPAAAGGGAAHDGRAVITGRHDSSQLASQVWNDPRRYQLARQRDASRSQTPESLVRRPDPAYGARVSRPRAHAGSDRSRPGDPARPPREGAVAAADDQAERRWRDADPVFDPAPAGGQLARAPGSVQAGHQRPLVDRGALATEADRPGPARDAFSSRAASDARHPGEIELSRPSAGGPRGQRGVRGPRAARGVRAGGAPSGQGTAQVRADVPVGPGRLAVRASRQNPYFRRMFQRLDAAVRFPHQRALNLDQGQVVVSFTLTAGGAIRHLHLVRSSGFADFDRELLRAVRAIGPLGPVPRALRGQSDHLVVTVPYWFRNPLIR